MKCPQCNSIMENYDSSKNSISQVLFYRCHICNAEHVSSHMLTHQVLDKSVNQVQLFNINGLREEVLSI